VPLLACLTTLPLRAEKAAVFKSDLPGANPTLAQELADAVKNAGYEIQFIDTPTLLDAKSLNKKNFALLVLPGARALPVEAAHSIKSFLQSGGNLLAAGLPAWQTPLYQIGGRWISVAEYEQTIATQRVEHLLFDFGKEDLSKWQRITDNHAVAMRAETVAVAGRKALHVALENLSSWETLANNLPAPIASTDDLICFRAKGTRNTSQLSIELAERDGSRWIAIVDLTVGWKNFALSPETFRPWMPPPNRSGENDCVNLQNVVRLSVGLARTHTGVSGKRQEYWIADIGTARHPFGHSRLPIDIKFPHLETFSPTYQFFPVTTPVKISTPSEIALASPVKISSQISGELFAMQPRPRSVGYNQGRPWRWQPILEARAKDGDYRGAIATLALNFDDQFRGGIWACFTPADLQFYQQPEIKKLLSEVAANMRRGLFLREGGAEFFTVFEDQSFNLGARAVNFSNADQNDLTLRLVVKTKADKIVFSRDVALELKAGEEKRFEEFWRPTQWPDGGLIVTTELLASGKVIDRLSHELNVWRPKAKPEFIQIRDGGFFLNGKPWKVHGVNYMPSSGIGVDGDYFEHWVGPGAYDPEVIERDLRRIKNMGLNSVSVFIYHQVLHAQHMLDFLRRCDALGLHANVALRPGTPLNFRWTEMKELIEFYRMAQNDTIFAYDLAWEPSHSDERSQQHAYGRNWTSWVKQKHGSMENAEKFWGTAAVRMKKDQDEILRVPSMEQLTHDGAWRKLIADYRAFLDDELGKAYGEARRLVKSIDPNHAVSFRMTETSNPTYNWDASLAYDFYGLASAVDIWEPEAYGRIGNWDRVKDGRFEREYARLCDAGKPFIWAEMGYSVWDRKKMRPDPQMLEFEGKYFSDFYRMMREAGRRGIFYWWYAGGYRLGEHTDFGIINPDGTDRPATKAIRNEGPKFLAARKPATPNYFIAIDRDRDARGIFGIYEANKEEFWRAVAEKKIPGFKWKNKPGQPANLTQK